MRKISALIGVASILCLALTGCGYSSEPAGESVDDPISSSENNLNEVDYELPDGTFITCLEYSVQTMYGTLTCERLNETDKPADVTLASDKYEIVYVATTRGDELTCLDYLKNSKYGVFACVPSANR